MTDSNLVANAVVASSNSQYISIVPENGEQFNPQQKIIYNIEPEIGYIKKDSFLVLDIQNTSADSSRYTLSKNLGAHAIIDRVDIFSKETGILLESNTHYREWCNIDHQYLHDTTQNLSNCEGVGKPVQSWTHAVSAANVVDSRRSIPTAEHIENNQLSPVDNTANGGALMNSVRRFCIPLKVGLFGAYEADEKAIPVMNFGGIRIEITLAKAKDALQRMGGSMVNTLKNYAQFHEPLDWVAGVPLIKVDATDYSTGGITAADIVLETQGIATSMFHNTVQDLGLVVGNKVKVVGKNTADADFTLNATITTIAVATAKNIILNGQNKSGKRTLTVGITFTANAGPVGIKAGASLSVRNEDCSYKLMNTEFRLKQIVAPPNMMDAGMSGINYQFTGYEVFFDNIPTATLRHQIPLNSVASKALAIFTQLYYSNNMDGDTHSAQDKLGGNLPDQLHINELVYFINNRLYPLRSYNPKKHADRVLCINELVKAFRAIGKQPMTLGSVDNGDMEDYTNTPLLARELARNGMVFDLRNAEPEIRLNFDQARSAGEGLIRANTFIFSKKIIQTTATGLQVIH